MFHYKLRTLLIVVALGPPLCGGCGPAHRYDAPSRAERVRQGFRDMDEHAKNIEAEAKPATLIDP